MFAYVCEPFEIKAHAQNPHRFAAVINRVGFLRRVEDDGRGPAHLRRPPPVAFEVAARKDETEGGQRMCVARLLQSGWVEGF